MSFLTQNIGAFLSALGGVIAAVITYLGVKHTQRQATKAQVLTAQIEQSKVNSMAYTEARKIWDSLISDLRNQVSSQRSEIADLRRAYTAEMRALRADLTDLARKRQGDRQAIHLLTVYARDLLKTLKAHGVTPPPPPEGLDMDGEPWSN